MSPTSMTVSRWSSSPHRADGGMRALRGSWRHRTSPIFDRAWESLEAVPGRLSQSTHSVLGNAAIPWPMGLDSLNSECVGLEYSILWAGVGRGFLIRKYIKISAALFL